MLLPGWLSWRLSPRVFTTWTQSVNKQRLASQCQRLVGGSRSQVSENEWYERDKLERTETGNQVSSFLLKSRSFIHKRPITSCFPPCVQTLLTWWKRRWGKCSRLKWRQLERMSVRLGRALMTLKKAITVELATMSYYNLGIPQSQIISYSAFETESHKAALRNFHLTLHLIYIYKEWLLLQTEFQNFSIRHNSFY